MYPWSRTLSETTRYPRHHVDATVIKRLEHILFRRIFCKIFTSANYVHRHAYPNTRSEETDDAKLEGRGQKGPMSRETYRCGGSTNVRPQDPGGVRRGMPTARGRPDLSDAIRTHSSALHAQGVQVDGEARAAVHREEVQEYATKVTTAMGQQSGPAR